MALTLAGTPAINGLSLPTDSFSPGMVLVNKTDFSAVASVSLNNVFTSTYENYRVLVSATGSTVGAEIFNLRLRAGGTDATAANYSFQYTSTSSTSVSANRTTGAAQWGRFGVTITGMPSAVTVDVFAPQTVSATSFIQNSLREATGSITQEAGIACYTATTQFDGFTIYPSTGTISGTVRVYGLRNA